MQFFFAEEPYSFLSNSNFHQNEGDTNVALNGAFSPLQAQS